LQLSTLARSAVFAPLLPGGRVEAVVQRLTDSMALGMLHDGEQLPPQQDLAAGLGVSLVTLREALFQLQRRGLVETRRGHGGGSFVKLDPEASALVAQDRLYQMSSHELVDLADMQRAVSGQASRLAAERGTPDFVARLRTHIDHLEQARTRVEGMRIDGRFLIEVAATSQSVRLTHAEMRLQAEVNDLRWLAPDDGAATDFSPLNTAQAIASHRGLIAAIAAGDATSAQSIAEARIEADLQRLVALHMRLLSA
jgi:DNA-binding FadR family transcriptional regulator